MTTYDLAIDSAFTAAYGLEPDGIYGGRPPADARELYEELREAFRRGWEAALEWVRERALAGDW